MNNMIRAGALTLALLFTAACSTFPSVQIGTAVTLNSMAAIASSYGIALSGARTYKSLCAKKILKPDCRQVVVTLQRADAKAIQALDEANSFIKAYPEVDATNIISAARTAVDGFRAVVNAAETGAP